MAKSDGRAGQLPINEAWMHLHKGIVMPSISSFINELTGFQAVFSQLPSKGALIEGLITVVHPQWKVQNPSLDKAVQQHIKRQHHNSILLFLCSFQLGTAKETVLPTFWESMMPTVPQYTTAQKGSAFTSVTD